MADTLVLTVWLAMICGLIEGSYRLYMLWGRGFAIGMSPHVIWMAPAANFVWLLFPLGLTFFVGWVAGWKTRIVPVFVLYFIAALGLILLYQSLHKAAAVLLAAGVAAQLAPRTLHWKWIRPATRRSLAVLVALPILGGLTIAAGRWRNERQMLAAVPAVAPGRPNVLLIILDTVRDFNTSLGGYDRPTTPFLERLSGEGARFDLAMATASWTLPSHASMFTGQRPSLLSARLTAPLDRKYPVVAEAFARSGYATGGFVANLSYCDREHGLARGFSRYEDYPITLDAILGSSRLGTVLLRSGAVRRMIGYFDLPGRKRAALVNQEFLDWVSTRGDRPFFAFLNYFDAHQPYIAPEPFRSRFSFDRKAPFRPRLVDAKFATMTTEEIRWSMGEYDGGIAYQDAQVEALLRELKSRGLLDNTVVVITSDHGEHFGDHRRISHGNSLYRQLLEVPLVIRFPPRVPSGTVVPQPVSLGDIPHTLFDLAGISNSVPFPGRSLARFWDPGYQPDSTEVVLSEMPTSGGVIGAYSLVADGYHFIRWFARPPELFRLADDPEETTDLAKTPEGAPLLRRFAALESTMVRLPAAQGRQAH